MIWAGFRIKTDLLIILKWTDNGRLRMKFKKTTIDFNVKLINYAAGLIFKIKPLKLLFSVLLFSIIFPSVSLGSFPCDGEAYMSHEQTSTQLSRFEQQQVDITGVFTATDIGAAATNIQYDNLGFNEADGLLYGWQRQPSGSRRIVSIDATGSVSVVGIPNNGSGLDMAGIDVFAGDAWNGTMYLANLNVVYTVDLTDLTSVTSQSIAVVANSGNVVDWAYNPADGLLYGGSSTGRINTLNPATGARTISTVILPTDNYGGAWFDAAGTLFLYRNNGTIYEIDLSGPIIVSTATGPNYSFNDGAACIQDVIGAAKEMTTSDTDFPKTVTITYTFENFDDTATLADLTADDDLTEDFGAVTTNWTFTSITSSTGTLHNGSFNGSTNTELIAASQSLAAGATATVTVVIQVLNNDFLPVSGDDAYKFCNQILVEGTADTILYGDLSTDGLDPDPNGDFIPDERSLSCLRQPIQCNTQVYTVQESPGEFFELNFTGGIPPWTFLQISGPYDGDPSCPRPDGDVYGCELNNLGFRKIDGLLYAMMLNAAENGEPNIPATNQQNFGIVQIDVNGGLFPVTTTGATIPSDKRFFAGDVSPDGRYYYISLPGTGTSTSPNLYIVDLDNNNFVTEVPLDWPEPLRTQVADWAVNPVDGLLYGAPSENGHIYRLDPSDGTIVSLGSAGLPTGTNPNQAYGAVWFSADGTFNAYLNSGTIYNIDLNLPESLDGAVPTIVGSAAADPTGGFNDGAACVNPTLSIVKTASPLTYGQAGNVISYSYLVTNTGTVAVTDLEVTDDKIDSAPFAVCLDTTLDPAESTTCSASYTITAEDVTNESVTNTAYAFGFDPNILPVESPRDDETVNATQISSLSIVKTASPLTYSAVGDVISYSYLVTT
jgi:sugar lactone lactonase YvrE